MARKAFDGITVLEFAGFIAGPFCSKLLGDMGARVVKVESPGFGDTARHFGPFPDDAPDPEKSGLFLYLNTNKESVTLDISTATGRELFLRLAESADLLVEDRPPSPAEESMESMGLGYDVLQEAKSGLGPPVHHSVWSDRPQIVILEGPPRKHFSRLGRGLHSARRPGVHHEPGQGARGSRSASGGLRHRPDGSLGGYSSPIRQRVSGSRGSGFEVSSQESTMALNRLTHTLYLGNGRLVDRSRTYEYGGIYACKDGYVILYPREDRQWRVLVEIMGRPELADDERYVTRADRIRHGDEVNRIIGEWAAQLNKEEVYYKAAPSGCPAAYFATAEDVLRSPQLDGQRLLRGRGPPRHWCFNLPFSTLQVPQDPVDGG